MAQPNGYTMQENPPSAARSVAGAAVTGAKYAAGTWATWTLGAGMLAAMAVLAIAFVPSVVAAAFGTSTLLGVATVVGVGASIAAGVFSLVPTVLGGVFGAIKGYSREREMQAQERGAPPMAIQHAYQAGAQQGYMAGAQHTMMAIEEQMAAQAAKQRGPNTGNAVTLAADRKYEGAMQAAQLAAAR